MPVNMKRMIAALVVFFILTGVACADDVLEIAPVGSLDGYLNAADISLNDLDVKDILERREDEGLTVDLSQEANDAGLTELNRQKQIIVTKNATKKVMLGTRYQIVVPKNTIISCKSSSRKIAVVGNRGLITPKKAGQVRITIQTKKKTLILTLKIVDPTVPTKVVIQQGKRGKVYVGQTLQLTARVSPASASQSVKWKSSKKTIASVSAKGVVTGVKPGKALITAISGKVQAAFTVTVKDASNTPTPTLTPTPVPTSTPEPTPTPTPTPTPAPTEPIPQGTVELSIGDCVFTAMLEDNATARAFVGLLPMTLDMSELNGNEKYYYLDGSLPSAPERVGQIQEGDLMLYGNDCVVLFYKSFSTPYSYTRIGHIKDTSSLGSAVGSGSVQVRFTE